MGTIHIWLVEERQEGKDAERNNGSDSSQILPIPQLSNCEKLLVKKKS